MKTSIELATAVRTFVWSRQKTRPYKEDFIRLEKSDIAGLHQILKEVEDGYVPDADFTTVTFIGGPLHGTTDSLPDTPDLLEVSGKPGDWPEADHPGSGKVLYRILRPGVYRVDGMASAIATSHADSISKTRTVLPLDHEFCPHGRSPWACPACYTDKLNGKQCEHGIRRGDCARCKA
jgi:hypothetical protein